MNWFWRLLGYHVCEEFTKWEEKIFVCERAATGAERAYGGIRKVRFEKVIQQRKCTVCGKIERCGLETAADL